MNDSFKLVPKVYMKSKIGFNALLEYKEKKFKVCRIIYETDKHYIGDWMDDSNLFHIRFEKKKVKRLSISEMLKLNKFGYDLVENNYEKLNVIKNYLIFCLYKILFFIKYENKIKLFKLEVRKCGM